MTKENLDLLTTLFGNHFNNEMQLLAYFKRLKLTPKENKELVRRMMNHPHAINSRSLFTDTKALARLAKMIPKTKGEKCLT